MNKNLRYWLITTAIIFSVNISMAQKSVLDKPDFRAPVDIPMYLSGTFGELRSNHFHSGIDIKTQGVEGKVIRAIDDGWVSRIKISTGGYGKAIYITHPNGYVSVYGHLKHFNDTIQGLVIGKQYEKESYTIQIFPDKDEIKVNKGDIIAYSGNTGSSHGPHLHFEIREEKSQHPVNPLFFKNIKIKDYYRPRITQLAIYPIDQNSMINGKNDTVFLEIAGWGIEHNIVGNKEITVSGKISFGISTYDLMNEISNKNGVYSTRFFNDTTLVFELEMNKLSFNTTRYINSLIDYSHFINTKKRIIRTQVDTNNLLNNYVIVQNNGIINFTDSLIHNMYFEVKDAYGNTSKLDFKLRSNSNHDVVIDSNEPNLTSTFFAFSKKNSIVKDSIEIRFPANSFYRSFYFDYDEMKKDSSSFSVTYKLHNPNIPVHKYFTLKILPDSIPLTDTGKAYISYSRDNTDFYYSGHKKTGKFITCKSRELGYYKVMMDTISPIITEVNFNDSKKIINQQNLKIKIKDKETGIDSYRATLNDSWILMEYDPKKELLVYTLDDKLKKGKNNFKLIVTDMLDNESEYNCVLIY